MSRFSELELNQIREIVREEIEKTRQQEREAGDVSANAMLKVFNNTLHSPENTSVTKS